MKTKHHYSEPLKANVSTPIFWGNHLISSIKYPSLPYQLINYQWSK